MENIAPLFLTLMGALSVETMSLLMLFHLVPVDDSLIANYIYRNEDRCNLCQVCCLDVVIMAFVDSKTP